MISIILGKIGNDMMNIVVDQMPGPCRVFQAEIQNKFCLKLLLR